MNDEKYIWSDNKAVIQLTKKQFKEFGKRCEEDPFWRLLPQENKNSLKSIVHKIKIRKISEQINSEQIKELIKNNSIY